MVKEIMLSEICNQFGLEFSGENITIDGLGLCNRKTIHSCILSYVTNEGYVDCVRENGPVACLILQSRFKNLYSMDHIGRNISYIFSEEPEKVFYTIHEGLCRSGLFYETYDFPSQIGNGCHIADSAVIEAGVIIGNKVTIGHNTVIRSGTIVDDEVTIGCNSTIGSEGFQIITSGMKEPKHITHVGRCHICSNVYVGDNTCICKSLFEGETYIGEGVKIDNLTYIAHNIRIEKNAVITAHVDLCGSCTIEEGAWIAPNTSILNRVTVGKYAKVGMGSVVTKDVDPYTTVYGNPAKEHNK